MQATKRRSDEATKGRTKVLAAPSVASSRRCSAPAAFTLTELLVVIGIIVLLILLAVPAFGLLTGSRSVDRAENDLSALLSRARLEAQGSGGIAGVAFVLNHDTLRVQAVLVRDTDRRTGDNSDVDAYLDAVPGARVLQLPSGVWAFTMSGAPVTSGVRTGDGYIGFNTTAFQSNTAAVPAAYQLTSDNGAAAIGGAILFDGQGRLVNRNYIYRTTSFDGTELSDMAKIIWPRTRTESNYRDTLLGSGTALVNGIAVLDDTTRPLATRLLRSNAGVAIFQRTDFLNAKQSGEGTTYNYESTPGDPTVDGATYASDELGEEVWIDQNARLLLVNRYNGTLLSAK